MELEPVRTGEGTVKVATPTGQLQSAQFLESESLYTTCAPGTNEMSSRKKVVLLADTSCKL